LGGEILAIYVCTIKKCQFTFERRGKIDACPNCGSAKFRIANDEETAEFKLIKAETGSKMKAGAPVRI
jgi:Zn finger protein HypA/HybF involved in hydrogenase expression